MCSTASERLARLGRAIDELAADSLAPDAARPDASMGDRLARIWAMVAELDPELARRVSDYDPGSGPGR
jgi:transposase